MRGRGSFRGSSQRSHGRESNAQGGPLITSHLRELDIELEILKRKRDMIQQEHELLHRERQFNLKRQYQQEPCSSYSQNSYRADYDSSNYYRPQGNKRQAVEPPLSRRYEPPQRVEPWAHNNTEPKPKNYNNPKPQPQPLLSLFMDPQKLNFKNSKPAHPNRQNAKPIPKSLPPRKDFNPTKVTKPKLRTPYIQKQQTEGPTKNLPLVGDDLILQPNVKPSPQMNGRLELALGSIMKDIKQFEPTITNPSMTFYVLKMIKKIIRGRIRGVMTGKVVGHVTDIVDTYRKKYPKDTDAELFELGKQAHNYNLSSLGEKSCLDSSEEPKKYFKMNITKLLSKKLEEIFTHAKNMYADKDNANVILKQMNHVADLTETKVDNANADSTQESMEKEKNDTELIEKNIAKAEAYAKLMEALIEDKLPKLLPRFKQNIVSVLDVDKEYNDSKAIIEEETIKLAVKLMTNKVDLTEAKAIEAIKNDTEMASESPKVDLCQEEETKINEKSDNTETSAVKVDLPLVQNSEIVANTPENSSVKSLPKNSATPNATTPAKIIDYPYFVKLIGRPELPSRQAVYDFLQQFKPASIKKHKTVSNLLVLGFNEKDGYDKILEASGTAIGTNTMIAKASEKVATTPQNTPVRNEADKSVDKVDKTEKTEPEKNKETSLDANTTATNLHPSNLDKQITNLLTTIRQTDEHNASESAKINTESQDMEEKQDDKSCDDATIAVDTTTPSTNKAVTMETIAEVEEKTGDREDENKTIDNKITPVESKEITPNDNEDDITIDNGEKNGDTFKEEIASEGDKDPKSSLKESGRATPTRASARLATVTPSSIKTRRASRLALNNQ
ncbi:uncharacterized protein LOC119836015 [Zerene cesonia]|uniref:uncharacterized protein LOC119836015 n=1 Tax=Zerene cesonia TaxID=33412 RepID=UPI0018E5A334|nr:uncharacterized protein LOC119836015 [Zerene cesonia]